VHQVDFLQDYSILMLIILQTVMHKLGSNSEKNVNIKIPNTSRTAKYMKEKAPKQHMKCCLCSPVFHTFFVTINTTE